KIDYLYELEYVSEDSKVPITTLPLLNPYKAFTKQNSTLPKVIKQVFGPSKHAARELILASQMEQHWVPATVTEQMIPLHFNEGMVHQWKTHGYTHLHYGAIRLALTLHGRKCLLVVAYKEYQHACISTIQITLNAGTIFVTLYPNFNIAVADLQTYQNMQTQLQITGASQVGNIYVATLHHQMAYRVQNHAMDLSLPQDTGDSLLIQLKSQHIPSCIHIPKQLPREDLGKLLPESWVTNYEKLHQSSIPIQSVDSSIYRRKNGAIEISFKQQDGEKSWHPTFCTKINAISPAKEVQPLRHYLPGVPINSFNAARDLIYAFLDETGHKFFDVCDCAYCLMDSSDEEEKTKSQHPTRKFEEGTIKHSLKIRNLNVKIQLERRNNIFGSSSFLPTRVKEQRPAKKKHPTVPKETPKISTPENTKTTSHEKSGAQFMVEHDTLEGQSKWRDSRHQDYMELS
ncbi:hypothetical protein EUTSA_v10002254mg, partial [Eutrema salsugineum]